MNERSAPPDSALPPPVVVERRPADAMPIIVWTHGEAGQTTYLNAPWTEHAVTVGAAMDVDDQRRAHDEQEFLVRAAEVLGTSLDPARTPSDVARLVALARLAELERQRGAR